MQMFVFVSHTIYCQYERGPSAATLPLKCDPDCDGDLPLLQNLHDMVNDPHKVRAVKII